MSDSEGQTKKTPIADLCKYAQEHYDYLARELCSWNSLIPEAIETYQRIVTYYEELDDYWNSLTWEKGFDLHTQGELDQLREFLGYDNEIDDANPEEFERLEHRRIEE